MDDPGVAVGCNGDLRVGGVVPPPSALTGSWDASLAGLLMPVMPNSPRSRRTTGVWVLSVLVDDRRAMGAAGAAAAAAGQHRWPRWAAGEAPAPPRARRNLLPRARRHRLGRAAGGIS